MMRGGFRFWKGSGLALMLDLLAAILSGGKATHQIAPLPAQEAMISQAFVAIDYSSLDPSSGNTEIASPVADQIIAHFQLPPRSTGNRVRYPGYRVLEARKDNLTNGVPVEPSIWQQLQAL